MGCHTWVYIAPKEQDEILSEILKKEHDFLIELLNSDDKEIQEDYGYYIEHQKNWKRELSEMTEQDIFAKFGSLRIFSQEIKNVEKCLSMTFDEYKQMTLNEIRLDLERNDKRIPQELCLYDDENLIQYRYRNSKIYLNNKTSGDSLGRIPEFYGHEFYDADSVIKAFKDNNCECDESTITKLFEENDAIICFG